MLPSPRSRTHTEIRRQGRHRILRRRRGQHKGWIPHLYAIHTQGTHPRGRASHPQLRRTTPSVVVRP
jgi:hypothetical protein